MTAINDIAEKYQIPVIYSVHPRSKNGLKNETHIPSSCKTNETIRFFDYNKLQKNRFVCYDSELMRKAQCLIFPNSH